MTAYNATEFDPPAPLAYVTLRNEATGEELLNVPMQLDTGADVTLVPKVVVDKLRLPIISDVQYELIGFDGRTSFAFAVQLQLLFCRGAFRGKYLFIDQDMGIIGRDILNLVPLLFDGPLLNWSEHIASK